MNATFHWFGSHQKIFDVFQNCHHLLSSDGILAVRFSLKENALEIKSYLEKKLKEFLGDKEETYLKQSVLDFNQIRQLLSDAGFTVLESEELRFTPFEDPQWDFEFMVKSQPINQYFNEDTIVELKQFLEKGWVNSKVQLKSHHGLFIARKT